MTEGGEIMKTALTTTPDYDGDSLCFRSLERKEDNFAVDLSFTNTQDLEDYEDTQTALVSRADAILLRNWLDAWLEETS